MKRGWICLLAAFILVDAIVGCLWWRWEREHRFDKVILAAARRYRVEPALVKAVVWQESRFNPRARGKADEIGLMQIRLPAAKDWAAAEHRGTMHALLLYDPAINTQVGAWYLHKLLQRYTTTDRPVFYALADYNAGRRHVLRWNHGLGATNSTAFFQQIDYPGTQNYITAVIQKLAQYRPVFPGRNR